MSSRDTALAVLLRKAEWLLDEAAFEVGGGRYSDQQRRELATALDELSATLRESTDEAAPTIIDVEPVISRRPARTAWRAGVAAEGGYGRRS